MLSTSDNLLEESCASRLAQANLHRLRGQWDQANATCLRVLYEAPESWRAHALLGDIAAERGSPEEAIQWYCMALEIRPDAQATRYKLSEIVNSRRSELNKTLTDQLARELEPRRPFNVMRALSNRKIRRAGLIAASGIIGLVAICLLASPLRSSQTERQVIEPAYTPQAVAYAFDHPGSTSLRQSIIDSNTSPSPVPISTPTAAFVPVSAEQAKTTGLVPASSDSDEAEMTAMLQSDATLRRLGIIIDSCVIDPSNNSGIVTVSSSGTQPSSQQQVLSIAEAVAKSALGEPAPSIQQCTIRYMTSVTGVQTIVFQGSLAKPNNPADQQGAPRLPSTPSASIFSAIWWSPLFSQNGTDQSSGAPVAAAPLGSQTPAAPISG